MLSIGEQQFLAISLLYLTFIKQKRENYLHSSEIRALTGLRGIAACYVVLYHFHGMSAPDGPVGNLIRHGYIAVDLFFVLSGFVMALTYAELFRSSTAPRAYAIFLTRRFARIYPLHACVTVLLFAASALALSHTALPDSPKLLLASNLLMIQAWGLRPASTFPPGPSGTEWAVYLAFPFLAGITLFSPARVACVLAIAGMAGIVAIAFSPSTSGPYIRYGPLDVFAADTLLPLGRCLCEFTLGLLCFRLESRASVLPDRPRGWLLAGITLGIALLLTWPGSDIILVPLFAVPGAAPRARRERRSARAGFLDPVPARRSLLRDISSAQPHVRIPNPDRGRARGTFTRRLGKGFGVRRRIRCPADSSMARLRDRRTASTDLNPQGGASVHWSRPIPERSGERFLARLSSAHPAQATPPG